MSDNEKALLIGNIMIDKRKAEEELALHLASATRLGESFMKLGAVLRDAPEAVSFENQPANIFYATDTPPFKLPDVDGNRVLELTNKIRELMESLANLKREAGKLGF